jgi:hypothetical protein
MSHIAIHFTDGALRIRPTTYAGSISGAKGIHRHRLACQLKTGDHVRTVCSETPGISQLRVVRKIELIHA